MFKKWWWVVISLGVLIGGGVLVALDTKVHLVFCDVGQGDSQLIYKGTVQVLVDAGASEEKVLKCLGKHMPFWDRRIEMVISTHPDKDHVGGMVGVLNKYEIGSMVISDIEGNSGEYRKVREVLEVRKSRVIVPKVGDRLRVGSLEFEIFWPGSNGEDLDGGVDSKETNNWSVISLLKFGEFEALLTGDATAEVEKVILDTHGIGEVEVLKVGHHGSKYSSTREFLERLKPKLGVIQVGKNNYGHPADEVLNGLRDVGSQIWRNDESGEIEITTDGDRYWLRSERGVDRGI